MSLQQDKKLELSKSKKFVSFPQLSTLFFVAVSEMCIFSENEYEIQGCQCSDSSYTVSNVVDDNSNP